MHDSYSDICVCEALIEVKKQQERLADFANKNHFEFSCQNSQETDTIPIMLYKGKTNPSPYCVEVNGLNDEKTPFFRIEKIDSDKCCAVLSLLRPLTVENCFAESICETYSLEKTGICKEVDLDCFCAVQCLDIDFMNRKVIVE